MVTHALDTGNMVDRADMLRALADRIKGGECTFALEREIGAAVEPEYGDPPRRYLSSLDDAARLRSAFGSHASIREPAAAWTAAILRDIASMEDAQARAHIHCADCRHSKVMADGSRRDRGWSAPCASCPPATKSKFEPYPEHAGPWALVFRPGEAPINNSWCERAGLPMPAVFPTRDATEAGAARMAASKFGSDAVYVVPHAEENAP